MMYNERPLTELLTAAKKEDLLIKAKALAIKTTSKQTKAEIASKIAEEILHHPIPFLDIIPVEDVILLQKMVHAKDHSCVISKRLVSNNSLMEFSVVELIVNSLKDEEEEEEEIMIIHPDLVAAMKPVIDAYVQLPTSQERLDSEQIILGLLNIYGILKDSELKSLYAKYKAPCDELTQIMAKSYLFSCNTHVDEKTEELLYISPFMFDAEAINREAKIYKKLTFPEFAEESVRNAGSCSFPMPERSYTTKFIEQLVLAGTTKKDANDLVSYLWMLVNNSINPSDLVLKLLNPNGEEPESKQLMHQLMAYVDFINNIPSWTYKGHNASYIQEKENGGKSEDLPWVNQEFEEENTPIIADPKVGRNDPCPCGSGLKHKKCCGDN